MSVITAVFDTESRQESQLRGRRILSRGQVRNGGALIEKQLDRVFLGSRPYAFDAGRRRELFEDPESGGGMVLDGVIDNRRDLAAALGIRAGEPEFDSDARLVFEAYRRWGRSCPSQLVGAFAFALWDAEERGLFCARDPFGVRSLYYTGDGPHFAVASQARQLVEGVPSSLNEEFLVDFLAQGLAVRQPTPFAGVNRLEPGHSLWFDGKRSTTTRYWDPCELTPFSHNDEERYHDEFRELFQQAIRSALEPSTPILCDLSGGLDSSSIACTLGELMAAGRERDGVHTMTFVLERSRDVEEDEWRLEICKRYGFEGHEIAMDDLLMTDLWEAAGHWDEPNTSLFAYPVFRWYAEVAERAGATSVLNGFGGEAVVTSEGPVPVHLADRLFSLRLPSFFRQLRLWRKGLHIPLLNLLAEAVLAPIFSNRYHLLPQKPYEIPKWISPDFAARTDFKRRARVCWCDLECRSRELQRRVERLYRISGFLLRGNLEQAVLVRYPFLHRPLVEFVLRVPFEYKADPVETRKLLRRSMAGLLPERLRSRRAKPSGNPSIYYAFDRQWSSLEPAVRDPLLADLGIVDRSEFQKAMKLARIGHSTHTVPLLCTLALEFWARRVLDVGIDQTRVA